MAYQLYITRPPHYASRIRRKLPREAWDEMVAGDPQLKRAEDGDMFTAEEGCPPGILVFTDGNVKCANPDEHMVEKMVALAESLDAVVQGEDGELYTSGSELPYLVQFALFERVSRRLRIRFPERIFARQANEGEYVMEPITASAEEAKVDAPATMENEAFNATRMFRKRMAVGFPSAQWKPSPAIQALLNPLRPVDK